MDMKKILQALDGASTKPVEGSSDMSKFLRIVSEAEINQVPAMPDTSGIQPGSSKDLGNGEKLTVNQDGTVGYSGAWGTYIYNTQGQHVKTQSPAFAGYSQTTDAGGNVTQQNYSQGGMDIQKGPKGTTAQYQLGANKLQTQVNEGTNPHKVSLPVQMAMQHYQKSSITSTKNSLLKKYFVEAEEKVLQESADRKDRLNKKAKQIADRIAEKNKRM